jgi:diaminohydroxyphosphoribosylaminopyrimidine deaminase / 5-amino-6-(5-phosphoribosylamino)uracil reductase
VTAARFTDRDRSAMTRALELAARGLNTTDPNPRVGCVIVHGDRTVGEGWHERAGEPHAEIMALRAAGQQSADATAYVTLEPCSHFGRTPPCADALIQARVARVVFALEDPNPRVRGQGAERLRQAGVDVRGGLMQREASELNTGFIKRMSEGRPWVRVKLAMSLDGRTALASGASRWITGEAAREDVQLWRARSSALLTGVATVLADDPRLDVRLRTGSSRQPLRVVLDSRLRTPTGARLFASVGAVWIFTASADSARRAALEARGAHIEQIDVAQDDAGRLDLRRVLARLAQTEVNELHVEAGATLAGQLIREGLADELLVYVAPVLLGPQARPLLELPLLTDLEGAPRFEVIETQSIGTDLRLRLRPAGGRS